MRLKLLLNIGTNDAKQLGLEKTLEGEVVDVKQDVADLLLKRGWAANPDAKQAPATAEGLDVSTTSPTDFEGFTKEDLKAYATKHGIAGVSMPMSKDDMISTIKRSHPTPRA